MTVVFTPGSAVLPPSAPLNLRRFALAHKGAAVTITGKGEAVLPNPDAQARALDLGAAPGAGDRRRRSATAGVSAANLHLRAQAAGQGGPACSQPVEDAMSTEFHRIRRLPPYVFASVNEAKARARAAGEDIIDLGMGNPDGATPAAHRRQAGGGGAGPAHPSLQ